MLKYIFIKKEINVIMVLDTWIWSQNIQAELEKIEKLEDLKVLKVCIGGIKNNILNAKDRYITSSYL